VTKSYIFFWAPAFVVSVCVLGGCQTSDSGWAPDRQAASKLAIRNKRPLLTYFRPSDAKQDAVIRRVLFANSAVQKELSQTVHVALDGKSGSASRTAYGVHPSQPCVVVCKPSGLRAVQPIYLNPVPNAEYFAQWLRQARTKALTDSNKRQR
jgi:hypothetical protein